VPLTYKKVVRGSERRAIKYHQKLPEFAQDRNNSARDEGSTATGRGEERGKDLSFRDRGDVSLSVPQKEKTGVFRGWGNREKPSALPAVLEGGKNYKQHPEEGVLPKRLCT